MQMITDVVDHIPAWIYQEFRKYFESWEEKCMSAVISEELKQIIADPETLKAVATVNKNGIPHVVFKGSLHVNGDGQIE